MKKTILISGASKNLGLFLGNYFKNKFRIVNLSRNILPKNKFDNYKCDLADETFVKETLIKVKKKYRKLELIISCAGNSKKDFTKIEKKKNFQNSFNDNFYSLVNLVSSYLEVYNYKPTKIVAISSIAGNKLTRAPITYSVAKSALNFYSRFKAKQLAEHNISLNIISPGNILQTGNNWHKKIKINKKQTLSYIKENVPMNKFCNPEDIAEAISFILHSKNNMITGANIIIDGGEIL